MAIGIHCDNLPKITLFPGPESLKVLIVYFKRFLNLLKKNCILVRINPFYFQQLIEHYFTVVCLYLEHLNDSCKVGVDLVSSQVTFLFLVWELS